MHSAEYLEARKEYINALCFTLFTFGVSGYLALTYWRPKMKAALEAEEQAQ